MIHIFGFATTEIIGVDPKEASKETLRLELFCHNFSLEHHYGWRLHKMTKDGSSSTPTTPSSSMYLNGLIIGNERSHKIHENPNNIPRLGDIWLLINPPLFGGCAKFFQPKHSNDFKEGNRIIRVELSKVIACVISWRLCKSGNKVLSWVYVGANEIRFSSRIKGNQVWAIKIKEEQRLNFVEI